MILNLFIILLFGFNYCLEKHDSKDRTHEISEVLSNKKCQEGFSGINCNTATCSGYNLCKHESKCIIKNNRHVCVCSFNDENGIYVEIQNCIRKNSILHGVCYLNSTGHTLCECEKGWIGKVCEQKLFSNPILNKIDNFLSNKLTTFRKSKFKCDFELNGQHIYTFCVNSYRIQNGYCYLVFPHIYWTCVCDFEWSGNDYGCDKPSCYKSYRCKNGGVCYIENVDERKCRCLEGWFGPTCEIKCEICCGRGTIEYDEINSKCYCQCTPPYLLPDCIDRPLPKKFSSDNFTIQPCNAGFYGANCNMATCRGYKLCMNESICAIKDNRHLCVCSFFDKNGRYFELKDCIKKYFIQNGLCYTNTSGHKICNCEEGWSGENCQKKLLLKSVSSQLSKFLKNTKIHIRNFLRQKLAVSLNSTSFECGYYNKNGTYEKHLCTEGGYDITNGRCYITLPGQNTVCACEPGWSGGLNDCSTRSCYRMDKCQNGGSCYIAKGTQKCDCATGFYGEFCTEKCTTCCGHGVAIYDYDLRYCRCECDPPYFQPDCIDYSIDRPTLSTKSATKITTSTYNDKPSDSIDDNETGKNLNKNSVSLGLKIGIPIAVALLLVIIGITIYLVIFRGFGYRKHSYILRNTNSRL